MRNSVYILNILFLLPMWMSKTIQPIYWEMQGKLSLFSASYVAMALAGALSVAYIGIIRRMGLTTALTIGFLLYALGLVLRAYPINTGVAILTGLIAGIGASVTGLSLKALILETPPAERDTVVLHTDNINTVSQSLGTLISGLLVTAVALFSNEGYRYALMITGLLTTLALLFIPRNLAFSANVVKNQGTNDKPSSWQLFQLNRSFYSLLFASFFLNGTCWAVIIPLVPIYLKTLHLPVSTVGMVIAAGIVMGLVIKNLYIWLFGRSGKSTSLLVVTFLTIVPLYLSFVFLGYSSTLLYSLSIVGFYAFRTLHSLLLSMIEIGMASQQNAMMVLSLRQTAFLSGDIFGGIAMPVLHNSGLLVQHPSLIVIVIALASVLIISCTRLSEDRQWKSA